MSRWAATLLFAGLLPGSGSSGLAQSAAAPIELVPTVGHSGEVKGLAFSKDGRFLLSSGTSGVAKLWDVASGRLVRNFQPAGVTALAPDARRLAVGSGRRILLLDAATGSELLRLEAHPDEVEALTFSEDGSMLASAGADRKMLWDASSGQTLAVLRSRSAGGASVRFSPDGTLLAVGGRGGGVELWSTHGGKLLHTCRSPNGSVKSLRFSGDGRFLTAAGTSDVAVCDTTSGKVVRLQTEASLNADLYVFDALPDRRLAAFRGRGTPGNPAGVALLHEGRPAQALEAPSDLAYSLAFSPDGRWLAAGQEQRITVWDAVSGRRIRSLEPNADRMISAALSPDDRLVATASYEGHVRILDATSGALQRTLNAEPQQGGSFPAVFSPDGRLLAAYGADGKVLLLDPSSGKQVRALDADVDIQCASAAFAPGSSTIAVSSGGKNGGTVALFDTATGRRLRTLPRQPGGSCASLYSADGRVLAFAGFNDTIGLWDNGRRTFNRALTVAPGLTSFALSPDGRMLVAGLQGSVFRFFDTASGKLLRTLPGAEGREQALVYAPIAISRDGRLLALGRDRQIELREPTSGRVVRVLPAQRAEVSSLMFSGDGTRLLSATADEGALVTWRVSDGEKLATTFVFPGDGWLSITPEGFFDANDAGLASLSAVRGLEVFSMNQLYQALHRPDLLREKLSGDPAGVVAAAAAKLDLGAVLASGTAPKVTIESPADGSTAAADRVEVEASLADGGGGVGRVEWRVNGVTLGVGTRGLQRAPEPSAQTPAKRRRTLPLNFGENTIEVVAYNGGDLIASVPVKIKITRTDRHGSGRPHLRVLAVGINNYWDSRLQLFFAASDAKSFADALRGAPGGLYAGVDARVLTDADATTVNIAKAFDELAGSVQPEDVFVFFLAGHGKTVDGRYYFLPQEFRYAGPESIVRQGIGQDRWQELLARIPARKSVLLFDSCESGSLTGDRVAQRGLERVVSVDRMTQAMGRTTLTAATDDTPALEGFRGHGIFTYALLEALSAADTDRDGNVDVTELAAFIDRRVPEVSFAAFKMRQVPQMKIVGSNFPVFNQTAVKLEGAPPPRGKPTHVVIAEADVRASARGTGAVVTRIAPGTQVEVMENGDGWALIARNGAQLGFIEAKALVRLQ